MLFDERIIASTIHLEWCLSQCINGDLSGDNPEHLTRLLQARQELRNIQRNRDILVITSVAGHWAVPYTAGNLKQLRADVGRGVDAEYLVRQIKGMGGQGLIDEQGHETSFYQYVVVHK